MERSQFTFYRSFADAAVRIRSKSARCDYYESIINYALHEREPDFDGIADAAAMGFVLIRPTLDASRQKAVGGQRGGKAEGNRKPGETASIPEAKEKLEESGTEKENENEIENEDECEKKKEEESQSSAFTAAERDRMITDSLKGASEELREAVRSWARYKSERREPYKPTGFAALLSQIARQAEQWGDDAVAELIAQSMSSGYKGILFDRLGRDSRAKKKPAADPHRDHAGFRPEDYKRLLDKI